MNIDEKYQAWKERPFLWMFRLIFPEMLCAGFTGRPGSGRLNGTGRASLNFSSETFHFNMPPLPLRPLPV